MNRTPAVGVRCQPEVPYRESGLGVKHFDERRERPTKRMLALEEEQRILANAPPYLRVAIVLLAQTGGRTYTEGLSLRWDQIDLETE